MEHFLRKKSYSDSESIRKDIDTFFASKRERFYKRGIQSLPERWAKVVANNRDYFKDKAFFFGFFWINKVE
jgi:hypothetical protein